MSSILLKPITTEKTSLLTDKNSVYVFRARKTANKIEIKQAVEELFKVDVVSVKTMIMPGKTKNRYTKRVNIKGATDSYKKALVQIKFGQTIDFYNFE